MSSFEFWSWLQAGRDHAPATPAAWTVNAASNETAAARICPECGHILAKYKVGHSLNFALDRCGNCGGIWFDGNEWEVLQKSDLRDKIHLVFSAAWQQQVRHEERARHLEKLFAEKIGGKDFVEIKRIRDWLRKHTYQRELSAFLNTEEF
jgi:Zn-finger nucleic acid-binding protein